MKIQYVALIIMILGLAVAPFAVNRWIPTDESGNEAQQTPAGKSEVVFWHFWGGSDRDVVEDVVARFNASQETYFVRAIAMPGNNLQAKLFLSVAGQDPPDLVNQDDPILADWAERGIITPIDEIDSESASKISSWMFESARRLSTYDGRLFGVCNGLDIRALYYNKTSLDEFGLAPPSTIEDLDRIANTIATSSQDPSSRKTYGYLPDSRRLWAWGYVFGGSFLDSNGRVTADDPGVVEALNWMQGYSRRYGADNLVAFRQGDQSLPGKTFPLLPIESEAMVGRYVMIMDGQWRTRDIRQFLGKRNSENIPAPEFGVCPLPSPENGRKDAGWVNGNFFVVPRGSRNATGALAFMKFWIGMTNPDDAAKTCAAGGWIPVSESVVNTSTFQEHLTSDPLFAEFVRLASSPNQFPVPQVPGAPMFRRTIESAAYDAMIHPEESALNILSSAGDRIQVHLDRVQQDFARKSADRRGN